VPSQLSSLKSREWLFDITVLALLMVIFYTLWLGSYPLFTPDEGRYSEVAREMVASGDFVTPRVDGVAFLDKPVLYYWLQATAISLFGVKEWALRLFPALFGIVGCLLTYSCGRRLFDRRTGLLSAIILAATPLYFSCGHYANLDLEVAVLITSTLFCFITGVQSQGRARTLLIFSSYILAALAFLTKGLIGLAFPCMIAGSWIILMWRWDILKKIHLVAGITLFFLIVLPWYYLVQKANPEFLHYFFVTQQVQRFLSGNTFNNATPFWFYAPVVLVGFFPWSAFLLQAIYQAIRNVWQAKNTHQNELFLLLWLFIVFIFFSIPTSKTISYILPVFPPMALLTGKYLSSLWEKTQRAGIYASQIILALVSMLFAGLMLASLRYQSVDYPPGFEHYLVFIIATLSLCALASVLLMKRKTLMPLFILCTVCSVTLLLTLVKSAVYLNQTTAKPLVENLKTVIQPQDEVVTYFKYYHDVPLYLGQRVSIVADWQSPKIPYKDNWLRELWYGMAFQKTDQWLINEATFQQRWKSGKRVFVFLNENYLVQFKHHTSSYFQLGRYNDIVLLSNQARK
jgi:4-amino-4-deoxy-L-arabinose transferase-like glycosyltransferase